jgi:methionyl-tRNA formyltransferase
LGTIGFHSSLLPKYRGRAPVNWAIIMGERETGVTMLYLTPEADAGDIIAQRAFPITLSDDCKTIYAKAAEAARNILLEQLPRIADGTIVRTHNPSRSHPSYPRRRPEDGLIDFNRSALDVYNWIRAQTRPYPGAFFFRDGERVTVWSAEIGERKEEGVIIMQTGDLPISIVDWEVIK